MIKGWTTKESAEVFRGLRVAVRRDTVRRADGSTGTYEYTESLDGVRVVALDDEGRITLVEENVHVCGLRLLLCPGGGCGAGEAPERAARRELLEEAGIRADRIELLTTMWRMPAGARTREHLYLATGLTFGEHRREASEADMELRRLPLEEAVAMCHDGRITEAGTLAAVLLTARRTAPTAGRPRAALAPPPAAGTLAPPAGPVAVQARHQEPVDVHLLLRRDGPAGPEVLLTRRAGAVYATGLFHLPSGHIDGPHEDAVQALIREAREETGVVVDPDSVRHAVTVHHRGPGGNSRIGLVFEVLRWGGEPAIMEPDLCDAMGWYPLADLPAQMVAYCRAALDAYRAGRHFAVHFQEPGDTVAFDPGADRLRTLPSTGAGADGPGAAVREFTERAVGRLSSWTDVSWARPGSRVWRAEGGQGGRWYVKVHRSASFHAREVEAYRSWVPGLGAAAPRLVAADAGLLAVVVTALPGTSLHGAVHTPEQQRAVLRRIGALAAAIHRPAPAAGPDQTLPVALGKLERHLDGARPHLAPGDEDAVRALAARAALLPQPETVCTHGDLQPRNLLLDTSGELYVIDFERSQPGPAVRDFVRLADLWAHRPDLLAALADGYGRPFTAAELEYLTVLEALDAVSGIQYGAASGDLELLERGLRTLARLRTAAGAPAAAGKDTA
ncbi:NUDIX domain-containing protein [Kitasatospora sp. NPDC088134]|uniref:NUDIX domain-containing protein n=1 Tax=Kitasatospora sp. NPDC088134 TaxID=3364071 RepID=UPI00382D88A9